MVTTFTADTTTERGHYIWVCVYLEPVTVSCDKEKASPGDEVMCVTLHK